MPPALFAGDGGAAVALRAAWSAPTPIKAMRVFQTKGSAGTMDEIGDGQFVHAGTSV